MIAAANSNAAREPNVGRGREAEEGGEYVTVSVAGQLFGLPIDRVYDVFIANAVKEVPLAPREIIGLLNLRGRVVTALCLRRRLGLPDRTDARQEMAVGLEQRGESFGLMVGVVGEVMKLTADTREANPVHMDPRWLKLSQGVDRLDDKLLIILDVDAVLSFEAESRAA